MPHAHIAYSGNIENLVDMSGLSEHPLALSLTVRDIDPDHSPKTGTTRDHLEVPS